MPRTELLKSARDYKPATAEDSSMGSIFGPAPEPQTELARYRILSPKSGVRVSPLALGAMSIGDQWTGFMGAQFGPEASEKFLDVFYEAGGNFIDTANNYQNEQSEMIIGEWMEKRGNREDIVLATKYTTYEQGRNEGRQKGIAANYGGNHRKNMMRTVDDCLKKLRTSYIDIFYLHWWDYSTSVEEVMLGLNDLVRSGKVLYLGVSDTPAWIVAQANTWARDHGLQGFVVYQGLWTLSMRDMEKEIVPMCRAFDMAIAPWGALGGGKYKTPEEIEQRKKEGTLRGGQEPSPDELKVGEALAEVNKELGGNYALANIALAWCRQKYPFTYPIIGGTKIEHLKSNIDALKIRLTDAQMQKLEAAVPFSPGFPASHFGRDPRSLPEGKPDGFLVNNVAHLKFIEYPKF